jgi:tRNA pseudouridine38-40 synthase
VRYFLSLSYVGTRFKGWQKQPGAITVQGILDEQIGLLLNHPIHSLGSGRTDAGVHARNMLIHFDTEEQIPPQFIQRLNRMLPGDIAVHNLYHEGISNLNVRFHSTWRSYQYRIHFHKDPFLQPTSHQIRYKPDSELLQKCAEIILGAHDFFRFQKTGGSIKTSICNVSQSAWEFHEDEWLYHIQADRFLRGMVRLLVGSMLEVGRGKLELHRFEDMIYNPEGRKSSKSAPAHGLCFMGCGMPEGSLTPIEV